MSKPSLNSESTVLENSTKVADSGKEKRSSDLALTGTILKDRFELLEPIGSGGMGVVYKAIDQRDVEAGNSRFIAIKMLNAQYRKDAKLLKALHSETRKTQNLAQANIIRTYDFDRDSEHVFMTMEYMEGVSLDKIIRGNPSGLPPGKALYFINQLVQALEYAHAQGLVHSDLKPGNILVAKDDHLKVLDFGISRLLDYNRTNEFDAVEINAHTPAYSTLEMIHSGSPDPRDDVYALACISYELFTGHHPFQRFSAEQGMQQGIEPEANVVFNSLQWRTIKQALNFDRSHRLKTVIAFWEGMQGKDKVSKNGWMKLVLLLTIISASLIFWLFIREDATMNEPVALNSNLAPENIISDTENTLKNQNLNLTNDKTGSAQLDMPAEQLSKLVLELNQTQFKLGENLEITFKVDIPVYVRIVLVNSAGELLPLFPNPFQKKYFCQPGIHYQVPPSGAQFTLDVQPPVGRDKIIAISSPVPFSTSFLQLDENGELLRDGLPDAFVVTEKSFEIISVD